MAKEITVAGACELLGKSRRRVEAWLAAGLLGPVRVCRVTGWRYLLAVRVRAFGRISRPKGRPRKTPPDSSPAPLSPADWKLVATVLHNPPVLPSKLKQAVARQKKLVKDERKPTGRPRKTPTGGA